MRKRHRSEQAGKFVSLYSLRARERDCRRSPSHQSVELFQEAHGGFAIWLDPFGMLDPQIVVNLFP